MTIPVLAAAVLLIADGTAFALNADVRILERALRNSLGEKTNFDTERVVSVREQSKEQTRTLIVALNANNSPTLAGVRHGMFVDVVKTIKVLKSWGWPGKVDRTMIGEYYPPSNGPNTEARLVLMCLVSSEKITGTDWDSLDAEHISDFVDLLQLDKTIK